jgi:predicted DNA repair protein MutK
MASSLLVLLDDIATVLDDVATMTKVAAKKTAGVLGDDLALNAQQVTGVKADRELPVVWAVAWGSLINKAILVPAALAISAFAPWAITPLLMLGGAFLCFEGFEKLAHKFLHSAEEDAAHRAEHAKALADEKVDMAAFERDKVKGAIRTDFILSAEIIVIALGTVASVSLQQQLAVLVTVSIAMTVGVYGFVAGIVKMDDVGLWLSRKAGAVSQAVGRFLLAAAPRLMKLLTVLGTAAMFLVGGGILAHGIAPLHHAIAHLAEGQAWLVAALIENGANALVGVVAGALVLAGVTAVQKLRGK